MKKSGSIAAQELLGWEIEANLYLSRSLHLLRKLLPNLVQMIKRVSISRSGRKSVHHVVDSLFQRTAVK